MFQKIFLFFLIFLFVFSPTLNIFGRTVVTRDLINFALIFLLALFISFKRRKIERDYLIVLFLIISLFVYTFIISGIFGFKDVWGLKEIIRGLMIFLASYMLALISLNFFPKAYPKIIVKILFYTFVVHGLIMIMVYLFPGFSSFLYSYVNLTEVGRFFVEQARRAPGLTSAGGALLSVLQANAFFFGLILWKTNRGFISIYELIGGFSIIIVSIILSGRTGVVILLFGFFLYLIFEFLEFSKRNNERKKRIIGNISIGIGSFLFLVMIILIFVQIEAIDLKPVFEKGVLYRTFEPFINYMREGEFYTASTRVILSEMYFWPDEAGDLFFGTSNFGRGEKLPYIPSDVGFVRMVFAIGLIGLSIFFLIFLYPLACAIKSGKEHFLLSSIVIYLVIVAFIVNFKELYLFPFQGSFQTFSLLFSTLVIFKKQGKVLKQE